MLQGRATPDLECRIRVSLESEVDASKRSLGLLWLPLKPQSAPLCVTSIEFDTHEEGHGEVSVSEVLSIQQSLLLTCLQLPLKARCAHQSVFDEEPSRFIAQQSKENIIFGRNDRIRKK